MNPLLLIHGYNADQNDPDHDPGNGVFPIWEAMLPDQNHIRFPWYSAIQFRDTFKAREAGHDTTYEWSYLDLSVKAARRLVETLDAQEGRVDILAHSLGSRVALQAIEQRPDKVGRCLMLGGAELHRVAIPIIEAHPSVSFFSAACWEDDVLQKLGTTFGPGNGEKHCIGNKCPAGMRRLPNFDEVRLDDPYDQLYFRKRLGADPRGDVRGYGDHAGYYTHEGNYPIYQAFFKGAL